LKIGIIITSFNNEETLEKTIRSAAALKKNNNIYIILIDDCSSDSSLKIAELARRKNQIDLVKINKKNLGVSKCRNIGIKLCSKTNYITFLDGDDYINPKFSKIFNKKLYGDLITFDFEYLYKNKILINNFYKDDKKLITNDIKKYFLDYLTKPNKSNLFTTCWAKLYKTQYLNRQQNLRFNEKLHICEDTDFVFKFLTKSKKIQYINLPIYQHTLQSGNKNLNKATFAVNKKLNHQLSFLQPVDLCKKYLIKNEKDFLKIKNKVDHCIGAYSIIYTIRSCIRINSFSSFYKTYVFWKKIYQKKLFIDAMNNYSSKAANGGNIIPYFIKKKSFLMAILIAFLIAKKRYL
jgi:glycosyltransferase involved in cell wall biosynthesis